MYVHVPSCLSVYAPSQVRCRVVSVGLSNTVSVRSGACCARGWSSEAAPMQHRSYRSVLGGGAPSVGPRRGPTASAGGAAARHTLYRRLVRFAPATTISLRRVWARRGPARPGGRRGAPRPARYCSVPHHSPQRSGEIKVYRSLVLKLSKSGSGVWAPFPLSLDQNLEIWLPQNDTKPPKWPYRTRNGFAFGVIGHFCKVLRRGGC